MSLRVMVAAGWAALVMVVLLARQSDSSAAEDWSNAMTLRALGRADRFLILLPKKDEMKTVNGIFDLAGR